MNGYVNIVNNIVIHMWNDANSYKIQRVEMRPKSYCLMQILDWRCHWSMVEMEIIHERLEIMAIIGLYPIRLLL